MFYQYQPELPQGCLLWTFTAGGLKVAIEDGNWSFFRRQIQKLVEHVDHNLQRQYARNIKQPAVYGTERAVFELGNEGLSYRNSPGIDLERCS